jgi:hypothetical protein
MDDKINIYVYILFIAISIVGGLIKNYNKKKEEERQKARRLETAKNAPQDSMPPIGGPVTTTNPFEEFLRRQLEQFEEPEEEPLDNIPTYRTKPIDSIPTEISVPIDTIPATKSIPIDTVTANFDPSKEGVSAFETSAHDFNAEKYFEKDFSLSSEIRDLEKFEYNAIDENDLTDIHEVVADFDATKAIIYSEILMRPVY